MITARKCDLTYSICAPIPLALAEAGILGTQDSTGNEVAARAGCENPAATFAKGMEDDNSPRAPHLTFEEQLRQ